LAASRRSSALDASHRGMEQNPLIICIALIMQASEYGRGHSTPANAPTKYHNSLAISTNSFQNLHSSAKGLKHICGLSAKLHARHSHGTLTRIFETDRVF